MKHTPVLRSSVNLEGCKGFQEDKVHFDAGSDGSKALLRWAYGN